MYFLRSFTSSDLKEWSKVVRNRYKWLSSVSNSIIISIISIIRSGFLPEKWIRKIKILNGTKFSGFHDGGPPEFRQTLRIFIQFVESVKQFRFHGRFHPKCRNFGSFKASSSAGNWPDCTCTLMNFDLFSLMNFFSSLTAKSMSFLFFNSSLNWPGEAIIIALSSFRSKRFQ